jgi:uncharacterized membrane protein
VVSTTPPAPGFAPTQPDPSFAAGSQIPSYAPPVLPGSVDPNDARDAQDNKGLAIVAYILFFIPLLTGATKTSRFVKFHTNQGTILFLTSIGISIVFSVISSVVTGMMTASMNFSAALSVVGIFGILWMVIGLGIIVLAVLGIVNAATGKMAKLPVIGRFTIIK